MKKLLLLLFLACILSIKPAESTTILTTGSNSIVVGDVHLEVTFVNQDPYPADPGSYVNLVFKLENFGTNEANNVVFELLPKYPFSLDPGVNTTQELGTVGSLQNDINYYLIKYKVRVDKDALNDEDEIDVKYTYQNSVYASNEYTDKFNITVTNPRTDFDVVVQDSTAGSTTLAIANIGANTAYSVILKIPEQQNFGVTGTSASIIGNLNAGDYTLESFQITSNTGINNITNPRGNITQIRSFVNRTTTNISAIRGNNLVVEIDYTDTLGIRRTVQKEVNLNMGSISGTETRTRSTQGSQILGQLQIPSGGLMYIAIGVVGIIVIVVIFRVRRRKKR